MTVPEARAKAGAIHPRFGVNTVAIEGFAFLDVSESEFVDLVFAERRQGRGGWVLTANCDILRQAFHNPVLAALFTRADAIVADGAPVIVASRLQGTPLRKGRICGANLIYAIPATCAEQDMSVFFLGGVDNSGECTAQILKSLFPGLKVVGQYSPPFGFEADPGQFGAMREAIASAQPDFVFVALGVPKSEYLIQEIRSAAPNAWWIGVGAAFDFVSGRIRRAPALAQRFGMEWLFRMVQEPKRLIRRYIWEDFPYAFRLFANALRKRSRYTPNRAESAANED